MEVAINNETSEAFMLEDLLRNEGHEGLIQIVNDLGHSSGLFTKNPQERFALIRIDKPFRSWESFIQLLRIGHEELAERHKLGNLELSTFYNESEIRSVFVNRLLQQLGSNSLMLRIVSML